MFELLKKITPVGLRRFVKRRIRGYREAEEKLIPKYELSQKHIANLKAVPNREALLELLPKGGIVAEIGVDRGEFSRLILQKTQPSKLHLIDVWHSKRYHSGLMEEVKNKFDNEISKKLVEINLGLSLDAGARFPDQYFDWVYIDTTHSYKLTRDELALYSTKVKPGGILAGHDFTRGNWTIKFRYGVIEAVYEFCVKNDWEIIYLSMENETPASFAIRKIR